MDPTTPHTLKSSLLSFFKTLGTGLFAIGFVLMYVAAAIIGVTSLALLSWYYPGVFFIGLFLVIAYGLGASIEGLRK